jgi:two-component system, NtrC family, C4-dicarboxylate transport sensor histidine kinase DctB
LRSVLCIPLIGRERPLGLIHMDSNRGELAQSEEDINFLDLISHFIAMGVENFELREERADREKATAVARTLSILSENLKTRLMILKGKFSLLQTRMQEQSSDRERNLFADVKTDFDQLTHVLDGMITYTRGRQITFQEVNPNEFLIDYARRLNPELRERGIQFKLELDKTAPVCWLDLDGVEQCLDYLTRNAIEALEGRANPVLALVTDFDENNFTIMIQDNGPGMSHTALARVLQPFYSTKGRDHVGLGLTFARKLTEDMGGRLDAQSEVDYGTTFSIVLPRRLPEDAG